MPWAPFSPASRSPASFGPTAGPFSSSRTTCGRRSGWRRSCGNRSSTSSPTIRSSSAKTARPTSRSTSWLRSGRFPGLVVLRPADACETVAAWQVAIERTAGPTALALSRQKLAILAESAERAAAGVPPRRLRPLREPRRRGRAPAHRHRLRGRSWRWRG